MGLTVTISPKKLPRQKLRFFLCHLQLALWQIPEHAEHEFTSGIEDVPDCQQQQYKIHRE
jgi:hypothetical protein